LTASGPSASNLRLMTVRDEIVVRREPPGIAWVVLDRPARRNAVTASMWRTLGAIFTELGASDDVRVIVLTGSGEHFCAGADIAEFGDVRTGPDATRAYEREVDACEAAIAASPRPTIAAIRGYCLGGGCGLALACDFRLADRTARFGIPAARLGIVYGVQECRNVLNVVGLANAKRILFTGQRFDAAAAAGMGLVDEVVDGSLEDAARAFATTLAENAPLSIAGAKRILTALAHGAVEEQALEIAAAIERANESQDYREGVRAFLEKRRPLFTGH
jgi:enoyl-CoA hydratase/carnithine racemase